jgi:D-glucuronyl C5-epimerase C-terminus
VSQRTSSAILNGWIFGLGGLWDVAVDLDEPRPMRMFEAIAETLQRRLREYDLGWWSRYSLVPTFVDLATPFYTAFISRSSA